MERRFIAEEPSIAAAMEFVEEELNNADVPLKTVMRVVVAAEEIIVNIVHYAYPQGGGSFDVSLELEGSTMVLGFKDAGIPFDPLAKEDPDITLSAEEREVGGLGILMVKKTMDDVKYEYKDGMNMLTLVKSW